MFSSEHAIEVLEYLNTVQTFFPELARKKRIRSIWLKYINVQGNIDLVHDNQFRCYKKKVINQCYYYQSFLISLKKKTNNEILQYVHIKKIFLIKNIKYHR